MPVREDGHLFCWLRAVLRCARLLMAAWRRRYWTEKGGLPWYGRPPLVCSLGSSCMFAGQGRVCRGVLFAAEVGRDVAPGARVPLYDGHAEGMRAQPVLGA